MQTERQSQPVTAPENAVLAESDESKSKRGGKRPGAGRKPNLVLRGHPKPANEGHLKTGQR
jgi:hypothetical protein